MAAQWAYLPPEEQEGTGVEPVLPLPSSGRGGRTAAGAPLRGHRPANHTLKGAVLYETPGNLPRQKLVGPPFLVAVSGGFPLYFCGAGARNNLLIKRKFRADGNYVEITVQQGRNAAIGGYMSEPVGILIRALWSNGGAAFFEYAAGGSIVYFGIMPGCPMVPGPRNQAFVWKWPSIWLTGGQGPGGPAILLRRRLCRS